MAIKLQIMAIGPAASGKTTVINAIVHALRIIGAKVKTSQIRGLGPGVEVIEISFEGKLFGVQRDG